MRENRAKHSCNSRVTRWVDLTIDHFSGFKMALVDSILREPQHKAIKISTYDEHFFVAKFDATKRSAKRFLLKTQNSTDFED